MLSLGAAAARPSASLPSLPRCLLLLARLLLCLLSVSYVENVQLAELAEFADGVIRRLIAHDQAHITHILGAKETRHGEATDDAGSAGPKMRSLTGLTAAPGDGAEELLQRQRGAQWEHTRGRSCAEGGETEVGGGTGAVRRMLQRQAVLLLARLAGHQQFFRRLLSLPAEEANWS